MKTQNCKGPTLRLLALVLALALILPLSLFGCDVQGTDTAPSPPPVSLEDIPEYSGSPFAVVNENTPYFSDEDITEIAFESYSELDPLGRCGVAMACLGLETMPEGERESISHIYPSGFKSDGVSNNTEYTFIVGSYLYNRCHLLGFQLSGENDNEKNLITGTRYLNIEGMLPFENMVADYIKESENHVLMRVTPLFREYDLIARGVLIEALSVEDLGAGIEFCVFAYNVQPGVSIDYYTGKNSVDPNSDKPYDDMVRVPTYILNTSSKKYHLPECAHTESIKAENRLSYYGFKESFEALYPAYAPCSVCDP